jgi:hypothetical protein
VAALSTALWLVVLLIGLAVIDDARAQHLAGPVYDARLRLYVVAPAIGLVGSGALVGLAKGLPRWASGIGIATSLFALMVVFCAFGGGI